MLLVHRKWSTEIYWVFTYRNSIQLENRTLQLQILLLLLLWVGKKNHWSNSTRSDIPVWLVSCEHPCRTVTHLIWTPVGAHFQNVLYSCSFCVRWCCPLLPQSGIVIKKRNFAPWKTVGTIVCNEPTKPSSIIPGEVNSCPTLLLFCFVLFGFWKSFTTTHWETGDKHS